MNKIIGQKSVEFFLIATAAGLMFGIPSGIIGAAIAFGVWEFCAWLLNRK